MGTALHADSGLNAEAMNYFLLEARKVTLTLFKLFRETVK
jgi:hypothetical protein